MTLPGNQEKIKLIFLYSTWHQQKYAKMHKSLQWKSWRSSASKGSAIMQTSSTLHSRTWNMAWKSQAQKPTRQIATRIVVHAITILSIAMNEAIPTNTTIVIIDNKPIAMLAIYTTIAIIAMLTETTRKIARAITTVNTRIARTINMIMIERAHVIIDWAIVPNRTIMPCK